MAGGRFHSPDSQGYWIDDGDENRHGVIAHAPHLRQNQRVTPCLLRQTEEMKDNERPVVGDMHEDADPEVPVLTPQVSEDHTEDTL